MYQMSQCSDCHPMNILRITSTLGLVDEIQRYTITILALKSIYLNVGDDLEF